MRKIMQSCISVMIFSLFLVSPVGAQGMPPAQVVVSEMRTATLAPQTEFVGTVYYQDISDIASEVSGLVAQVLFEEGKLIEKDDILVKLSSDLLEKTVQSTTASYEQVLVELESARLDFGRAEKLHEEQLIADKTYDDFRFNLQGLEKKAASLKAEVERLQLELQKKTVRAPFKGVILKKLVDQGEWLSVGSAVATVAKNDSVDVIVDIPGEILAYIKDNMSVRVHVAGKQLAGKVFTVIPRGDVQTRTFPLKIRMKNTGKLIEGMEARALLPTGKHGRSLTVPRDAIIRKSGTAVIYTVTDSHAKMIPVRITGYSETIVGVSAEGLVEGQHVVIKGNERLMNGQPVNILNATDKK